MIVFITHASEKTGFGHINRTVYLASLADKAMGSVIYTLKNRETLKYFQGRKSCPVFYNYSSLEIDKIKAAVFDMRFFSSEEIKLAENFKERNIPVFQITDLGLNSDFPADLVFDGSLLSAEREKSETDGAKMFTGPDYMILHHRFRHFYKVKRKHKRKLKNIFISFGGGTEYRFLREIVDFLSRNGFNTKVASGFCLKKVSRKFLSSHYRGVRFTGKAEALARPFFEADVALISAGVAAYESACTGTPALYIPQNREQLTTAELFEKEGAGICLGLRDDLSKSQLLDKLRILDLKTRIIMGDKAKSVVDGLGAYRILSVIQEYSNEKL